MKSLQNSNSQVFEDMSAHRSSRLLPQKQAASQPMLSQYDSHSRLVSNRLDNENVINEEYSLEKVIQRPVEPAEDKKINVKKIASRLDDDND